MIRLVNKIRKITFVSFIFFIISHSLANAKIYKEIIVSGNERLSVETIIMFSGLKIGKEIRNKELNLSIKNLYKTNYFKDIKILSDNNVLKIAIVENPIIQSISIKGVLNKTILNELRNITKKKRKIPLFKK